jgi:glycosyltransferase involved in cell wall biosynthesis
MTWKNISQKNIKKDNSSNEIFTLGYCINGINQIHKGYDLFQKIIKNLDKILKNRIRLICFGDDNFRKQRIVTSNIDIITYPKISNEYELVKIYSSLDLLMVTSRVESFCQVALEAMACSSPVVAFKVGGLNDLIEHKKNGFLVKNFNINKYSNTINFYIKKFRSTEMKKKSRILAKKKFDFKVVRKMYINIYKNICQK